MEYISIILNEDAAHECLADLGKLEAVQFSDVRKIDCGRYCECLVSVTNTMYSIVKLDA